MPRSHKKAIGSAKLEKMLMLTRIHLAVTVIDTAGLHELHEQLVQGEIDPHAPDRLRKLLTLIDSTPWWRELKTNAKDLKEALEDLIASVKNKEPDSAEKAGKVHGLYHRLVHDFYRLLPSKTEEASS